MTRDTMLDMLHGLKLGKMWSLESWEEDADFIERP